MSIATILVIAVLAAAALVAMALESGIFGKYARAAVLGFVLLSGTAITIFLMSDVDGKIGWGERMAKIERDSGPRKERRGRGGGGGEQAQQSGGSGGGAQKKAEEEAGKGKPPEVIAADPEPEEKPEAFQDCDVCPIMVVVQQGSFQMGAPDEEHGARRYEGPVRKVKIPKNFAVSKMEITRAQYDSFIQETNFQSSSQCMIGPAMNARSGYHSPGIPQDDADPVVCVDWVDAQNYVRWLSEKTGSRYRLLSEAEWEYTARAGTKTPFSTGDGVSKEEANFKNTWKQTQPTGSYKENAFGIKDMHGNVAEWVNDCWHDTLKGAPLDHKPWIVPNSDEEKCKTRVVRGGAWDSDVSEIRSASRDYERQNTARNTIGLRVAKWL